MICILACDSVSFPSLPQFPPLLVVLYLDKSKCLQQDVLKRDMKQDQVLQHRQGTVRF